MGLRPQFKIYTSNCRVDEKEQKIQKKVLSIFKGRPLKSFIKGGQSVFILSKWDIEQNKIGKPWST